VLRREEALGREKLPGEAKRGNKVKHAEKESGGERGRRNETKIDC